MCAERDFNLVFLPGAVPISPSSVWQFYENETSHENKRFIEGGFLLNLELKMKIHC